MSAYAALLSLRNVMVDIRAPRIIYNIAQLQRLFHEIKVLKYFLDNSCDYEASQVSAVETKVRDAALKAGDLFERAILNSHTIFWHNQAIILNLYVVYLLLLALFTNRTCTDVVPVTVQGLVAEVMLCAVNAVIFYIHFRGMYVFPALNDSKELRGVLHDFHVLVKDVVRISRKCTMVILKVLGAEYNSKVTQNKELPHAILDFRMVMTDVIDFMEARGNPSDLPAASASASASASGAASSTQDSGGSGKFVVVGLDNDLIRITSDLLRNPSKRRLASIVGMGGIGKATLARQVYEDPHILYRFDIRAWVEISQEYSLRRVLLDLLDSAKILTNERREDNEEELAVYLYQSLMYRRYIIVMDNVWDTNIWDSISRYFPENNNGSRVLLTSRLSGVASQLDSSGHLHQMRCLSDSDSWDLLCRKVFGAEGCPLELEPIGRQIAQCCGGLPLAIVVIGGLLYKDFHIEVWRDVAEKLKRSELQHMEEHCLEILDLSYNHLPHFLRPCFLYVGVFLQGDCEISLTRLVNLWVAEGFVEQSPNRSCTMEENGEDYLQQLVDRNLILVSKRSCNGKIRTCSMPQLLRDLCVQNARKENFLHVVESGDGVTQERRDESLHRLIIHPDALQVNATCESMSSYHNVRSVLCTASNCVKNPKHVFLGFLYLRVLDVLEVHFSEFPHQITKLCLLQYLAFHYDGSLPLSIINLKCLETIVHHCSFRNYPLLPMMIWNMPTLRHLYVKPGCYLLNPLSWRFSLSVTGLSHLQTLVGLRNFKWSKGITGTLPSLKKLGIIYDVSPSIDWPTYKLDTLVCLHRLESLKIIIKYDDLEAASSSEPPKLAFPQKLKKLTLSGCRVSWASMTTIGALPNLEALKLRRGAFCGSSWENVEGEFPQLTFLLLEDLNLTRWETDKAPFPRLRCLVIRSCGMLEEIPSAVGDISTLEKIELVNCLPSAKQIQMEQEEYGNEDLKVHIQLREADEMNLVARGVFPGRLQLLSDAFGSSDV